MDANLYMSDETKESIRNSAIFFESTEDALAKDIRRNHMKKETPDWESARSPLGIVKWQYWGECFKVAYDIKATKDGRPLCTTRQQTQATTQEKRRILGPAPNAAAMVRPNKVKREGEPTRGRPRKKIIKVSTYRYFNIVIMRVYFFIFFKLHA